MYEHSCVTYVSGEARIHRMEQTPYLSVIVPVYNEEENILLLHTSLTRALREMDAGYEVVYVWTMVVPMVPSYKSNTLS